MTKRMLIDASHAEETRVVVLDGNRLEEFDLETSIKRPLKGNVYLAKIVRVEPSLQAAFVEYGGNRHGFLAFGEIHPDYYQIPVADRQRLAEMQAAEAREEAEAEEAAARATEAGGARPAARAAGRRDRGRGEGRGRPAAEEGEAEDGIAGVDPEAILDGGPVALADDDAAPAEIAEPAAGDGADGAEAEEAVPETMGGEGPDDTGSTRRNPPRFTRHYKIQEVIRRRQILLVQVVKEERGGKGAALTTYVSLAGRFSVLMPNSPRGGGVSRKITAAGDRKRLREAIEEVGLPDGMSLIVRTAGASRPKPEIRRDCEYLLRLWDSIRERTLASTAPALIYEEADLIKRSIRDVFARDVEEIVVEGETAFQEAHEFMRALMPTQSRKIQLHRDAVPLFARHGVDAQLDAMHHARVELRSGGSIVINQTEALVAIDVNSGRATRERHIEDTALKSNLEAADEIARQLRLRDLAGLIVIDFIDMESSRHDAMVERRLKDALRQDRARIQVGRISHFGLLEMSRQRLRPSLAETSLIACPHCSGTGLVRSVESSALHVLRAIEEEGGQRRAAEIVVHVCQSVAFYLLNRKRARLAGIEERFGMTVLFAADDALIPPALRIERTRVLAPGEAPPVRQALRMDYAPAPVLPPEAEDAVPADEAGHDGPDFGASDPADARDDAAGDRAAEDEAALPGETPAEAEGRRRRRRRRRGGRRDEAGPEARPQDRADDRADDRAEDPAEGDGALPSPEAGDAPGDAVEGGGDASGEAGEPGRAPERGAADPGEDGRRGRRGRRGGRRRRGEGEGFEAVPAESAPLPAPPAPPRYQGPTPADPFAGQEDDIFAVLAAAEAEAEAQAQQPRPAPEPLPVVIPIATRPPAPEAAPAPAADPVADSPPGSSMPETAAAPAYEPAPGPEAAPLAAEPEPEPVVAPPPEPAPRPMPGPVAAVPVAPDAPASSGEAEAAPRRRGWWSR